MDQIRKAMKVPLKEFEKNGMNVDIHMKFWVICESSNPESSFKIEPRIDMSHVPCTITKQNYREPSQPITGFLGK